MALIYHYDPQIFSQIEQMIIALYKIIINYKTNMPNTTDTINKLNTQVHHIINNTK